MSAKWNVRWFLGTGTLYGVFLYFGLFERFGINELLGVILLSILVFLFLVISAFFRSIVLFNLLTQGEIQEFLEKIDEAIEEVKEGSGIPGSYAPEEDPVEQKILSLTLEKIEGLFYAGRHQEALTLVEDIPTEHLKHDSLEWFQYLKVFLLLLSHNDPERAKSFFAAHHEELEKEAASVDGEEFDTGFAIAVYKLLVEDDVSTKSFFVRMKEEAPVPLRRAAADYYLAQISLAYGYEESAETHMVAGEKEAPELFYWKPYLPH